MSSPSIQQHIHRGPSTHSSAERGPVITPPPSTPIYSLITSPKQARPGSPLYLTPFPLLLAFCAVFPLLPSPLSPTVCGIGDADCFWGEGRGTGVGGQPGKGRQARRRADPSRRRRRARCPTRPLPRPRPHSRSAFTRAPLPLPVALSRALGSLLSVASLLSFSQRTNSSFSCGRSLPSAFPTASASPAGAPAGAHAGAHRHRFSEEMVSGKGKWRERGNPGAEGEQRLWNRVIAVSQEITPRGRR